MVEGEFRVEINSRFPLERLRNGFGEAANFALRQVADRLLADSRIYVPVLTGALKDSGHVEESPTSTLAMKVLAVVYHMSYAEKQHEEEFRHPSLGFFGAAKYLAKPLELYGSYYLDLFTFEFDRYVKQHGLTPA